MSENNSFVEKVIEGQLAEEKENKENGKKGESFLYSIWKKVTLGLKNSDNSEMAVQPESKENSENTEESSTDGEDKAAEVNVSYEKTDAPESLQRMYFGVLDTEYRLNEKVSIESFFNDMDDYLKDDQNELRRIVTEFNSAAGAYINKRSGILKAGRSMLTKQKELLAKEIKSANDKKEKAEAKEKELLAEKEKEKSKEIVSQDKKTEEQIQREEEIKQKREEDLQKVQEEIKTAEAQIKSLSEKKNNLSQIDMTPSVDGEIHIAVTKDKSRAYAIVFPPCKDGKPVLYDDVKKELEKKKIAYGISEEALASLGKKANSVTVYLIAAGVKPTKGVDGHVTELYSHDIGAPVFLEDAQGVIDFNNLNWLVHIEQDSMICQITKAQMGKDGIDVYGNTIRALAGKKPNIPMGNNTYINEEGDALLSKISGQISYKNGRFEVSSTIIIPGNVDYSVGNLDVKGDIIIKGNVLAGFSVRATGDVTVGGIVEGAQIMSGSSIIVNRGMNGNMVGNLQAKGDIHCKFMENASAQADGDICANSMVNCSVSANGRVIVRNGLGAIIGGNTIAMRGIEADAIGNKAGRLTVLNIGVTPQFTKKKYGVHKELENIRHSLEESEAEERMGKGSLALTVLKMKEQKLLEKQDELLKIEENLNSGYISAGRIYPITQISFGTATATISEMKTSCQFTYDAKNNKIEQEKV